MKVLIKVGGTLLDHTETRQSLASQLAALGREHEVVVVHGGGKQLTRFLERQGVRSRFVNGLRVSDEAVMEGVTSVIAGAVNKHFVASLAAAGQRAIGLSGVDGGLTLARHLDPALGSVGEPVRSDGKLLNLLLAGGYLPVVACVAADEHGHIYNVNADRMAVSCAAAFLAEKLLFLTDVDGVKDAAGTIISELGPPAITQLIASGVAHGGMQAKLEAASLALSTGVKEIVIAPGAEPDICRTALTGEPIGTRVSNLPSHSLGAAQ